jgi:hypothetical protein
MSYFDRYTDGHWDHERDLRKHDPRPSDLTFRQRAALSKLIGYCEGVVASGILGEKECRLREIIAENLVSFGLPSKAECEDIARRVAEAMA